MEEAKPLGVREAFVRGFIITLLAAVIIPVVIDIILTPLLEDVLMERSFFLLSGPILVTLALWSVILILKMRLSAGQILKRYGVSGVSGLIIAYWYLGNPWGAAVPLLSIAAVLLFTNREKVSDWFKG